ncbi:NADPH:quinone reductase [Actinomadura atramentaria]|uniref:NADPH:quinone reductase n=1 Tax=Actinomadura atramentaria TaxID=1990 RepID=UPI00039D48E8|nr:NADPH:quinone reductase [Actinomadura atramentaria]
MRAISYGEYGGPDVLRLVERDVPEPGEGEVRVRIAVSGVNPTDWKRRENGDRLEGETVPHHDGAGVVDAVGPGVTEPRVGDRVWTLLAAYHRADAGTAQEFTVLPVNRVGKLPDGVDWDTGASLGVPALTAHRALTVAEGGPAELAPGALDGVTVLVPGGAGAVGHAAIQLARWAGATVIATVSGERKAKLATAAGAHHTVAYTRPDAADAIRRIAPEGVDIVVEVAAAANTALNTAVLAQGGTVAVYGNDRGEGSVPVDFGTSIWLNARYQFLVLYTVREEALASGVRAVNAALADGALPVGEDAGLPLHRFPLADTADAQRAVQDGAVGKVLVDL